MYLFIANMDLIREFTLSQNACNDESVSGQHISVYPNKHLSVQSQQ